jgi:aspartyl-tRNA(Asn)/glutamyl-tRNA(Gln) amidotransferase subunit C
MSDALRPEEVARIAELARLALTPDEQALYAQQLARILEYARQLAALPTEGVPPMTRVEEESALERPDAPHTSLPREEALRNAPDAVAGLFLVPRAVGAEEP